MSKASLISRQKNKKKKKKKQNKTNKKRFFFRYQYITFACIISMFVVIVWDDRYVKYASVPLVFVNLTPYLR